MDDTPESDLESDEGTGIEERLDALEAKEDTPPEALKEIRDIRKEVQSLRRTSALKVVTAKHGEKIAELAGKVPPHEMEAFADQLAELSPGRQEGTPTEGETPEAPEEEPPPGDSRLAAVAKGPAVPGAAPAETMSPQEILELGRQNPAEALARIKAQYRNP